MEFITRLHKCLAESRVAAGMFVGLNSPAVAELLVGGTDLDFIAAELQHAPIGADDSVHLLRAIQAANPAVTPMVRLPNHDLYWIQQSLDAGYAGLIVPLVESAEQAGKLVKAAYFPPIGDRSVAGSIRASLYGEELSTFNDKMILLPQIESAKGLENTEEIVAVEGVTGVLLGPADLSLSCGWKTEDIWSHASFIDAAKRVVAACKKSGKDAAILTGDPVEARKAGFNIIGFGGDQAHIRVVMTADANDKLAQIRQNGKVD